MVGGNNGGGDNGGSCQNFYILKLKFSTSPALISRISHPIDTYMVSLESHTSTSQLISTYLHQLEIDQNQVCKQEDSFSQYAFCRSGFHEPATSNFIIKMY